VENNSNTPQPQAEKKMRNNWKLYAVIAICAAPMLLSYFTYYVIKPTSRTNYGDILDPRQYPMPKLGSVLLGGEATELSAYQGKWIMLTIGDSACAEACEKKLYDIRQLRLAQGKEMDRLERVWLVTDEQPLDTMLLRKYDGMHVLRVKPEALKAWLPVDVGTVPSDHIYMIDPLGNLMMRFPKDADPNKIKKDLAKLLKASAIG
jgi:cytochrome oxidase Cu insertion factor (SCO1/SenC/PrrC family)